jgi:hypothetical protein
MKNLVKVSLTIVFTLSLFMIQRGNIQHVNAQCIVAREAGYWHNVNPATKSVTRIHVHQRCNDNIGNPVDANGNPIPRGPLYDFDLDIWGACEPIDCAWGTIQANRDSTGWIRATSNVGYAVDYIWVGISPAGALRVYIWNDFTAADGRADYASDDWFVRD